MSIQYKIELEQGLFLVKQKSDVLTITMLEDYTNQVFNCDDSELVQLYDEKNIPTDIYSSCIELHSSIIEKKNSKTKDLNAQQKNNIVIVETFLLESIVNNKEEQFRFLNQLTKNGRVPLKLSNNTVIKVCRPLLCFEEKDESFKTNRLNIEKQYWLKHLNKQNENGLTIIEKDMQNIAKIALKLF